MKVVQGLISVGAALSFGIASASAAQPIRDESHAFDFNLGQWHTSIERIADPFAAPGSSIHLEGTVTVRPVWNGRAYLEEIEADGPKGHWEGLTLFLYNPQSGQWSQNYANAAQGRFDSEPTIGGLRGSNIELYSQDTLNGRAILVRGLWSNIRPDSHDYEESYSDDGGRSWKRAFFAHLTRLRR
jgi:hypothetical protein